MEQHGSHCATSDFCLLLIWGTINIFTVWGYCIDGNFLMNNLSFSKTTASKLLWERSEHNLPPTFREISLSIWRSSLSCRGCDLHKKSWDLSMRLCDILKTSVPLLTQELDNQHKVNFKKLTRLSGLECAPDRSPWLFLLYYTGNCMVYTVTKLDYLELPLPYIETYIDEERMIKRDDKRMRCQDLPFLEMVAHSEAMWCHMTKE